MKTTMMKTNSSMSKAVWTMFAYFGTLLALFLITNIAMASGSPSGSLGEAADTIASSMTGVAKLITATSYVAGVGFALMGMLKLKAHKDNPTQVPLSQPIVLLAIAAGLVFLPSLIKTAGKTVWSDAKSAGVDASDSGKLGGE